MSNESVFWLGFICGGFFMIGFFLLMAPLPKDLEK